MEEERKREVHLTGGRRKRRRKGESKRDEEGGRAGGGGGRGRGGRRPVYCVYEMVSLSNISHKEIITRKRWINTSDGEQLKLHLCS